MFKSFLHGLARAFTLPRSVRNTIDQNPLTAEAKEALLSDLLTKMAQSVDLHVSDAATADAIKTGIAQVLIKTGVVK